MRETGTRAGTLCGQELPRIVPFGIGPLELIIVLVIVLVIFGPKRLPGLGRSLGSGMREFKDAVTGKQRDEPEDHERRELPSGGQPSVTADEPPRAAVRDE